MSITVAGAIVVSSFRIILLLSKQTNELYTGGACWRHSKLTIWAKSGDYCGCRNIVCTFEMQVGSSIFDFKSCFFLFPISTVGALLMAISNDWGTLLAGRAIVGLGVGMSLRCMHFPFSYFSTKVQYLDLQPDWLVCDV